MEFTYNNLGHRYKIKVWCSSGGIIFSSLTPPGSAIEMGGKIINNRMTIRLVAGGGYFTPPVGVAAQMRDYIQRSNPVN